MEWTSNDKNIICEFSEINKNMNLWKISFERKNQ